MSSINPKDWIMTSLSSNTCKICGKEILVQIFKNSGVCSENCRKNRDNDHEPSRGLVATTEAPIGGPLK